MMENVNGVGTGVENVDDGTGVENVDDDGTGV